jgi:hypothetical protein
MLGRDPGKILQGAALVTAFLVVCASAGATPTGSSTTSQSAAWVSKEFNFTYVGFTTHYSCDALQDKMKSILLELGARPDLQVRKWGCGSDRPGVSVQMNVLQPAGKSGAEQVGAHWKRVDLLAGREPADAAGDCELISEIKLQVLPLFTARNVDYSATCTGHFTLPGATRLAADLLVADPGSATASR